MLVAASPATRERGSGACGRGCAVVVGMAPVRACGAPRPAGIVALAVDERSVGLGGQGAGPSCLVVWLRQPLPIVPSAWPRSIDDAEGRCGAGLVGLQNPIRVDTDPPPCRNPRRAAPGERRSHFATCGRIERMAQSRSFLRRCPQRAANGSGRSERVFSPFDRNTATTPMSRAFPALSERNTTANVAPRNRPVLFMGPRLLRCCGSPATDHRTSVRPWWASQLLPLPASLTSGPHACGSQGRALCRGDRPARRRAGNAAKAASARCRAQSHDRAARKCRRRASRPSLGGQSPSRAQAATERG
jgi:hypothetical protein